ncbi:MAG: hypothetical protein QM758_00870 [Armatimonas sp.]
MPDTTVVPRNPFVRRSSWPSSFLTGLIGWCGFLLIGALVLGTPVPPFTLFGLGAIAAILQVLVQKSLLGPLQMRRHIGVGAAWGLPIAVALFYALKPFYPFLGQPVWKWLLVFLYVGPPVGAFLSYFARDDERIHREAAAEGLPIDYGRDGHWLEPFSFGAAGYLLAFLPFQSADLAVSALMVGAMSGVFAAGASHFSPDSWKKSLLLVTLICLIVGGIQGAASGWLFRRFDGTLWAAPILVGALGGVITYALTFWRGRVLAAQEEAEEQTGA